MCPCCGLRGEGVKPFPWAFEQVDITRSRQNLEANHIPVFAEVNDANTAALLCVVRDVTR